MVRINLTLDFWLLVIKLFTLQRTKEAELKRKQFIFVLL